MSAMIVAARNVSALEPNVVGPFSAWPRRQGTPRRIRFTAAAAAVAGLAVAAHCGPALF